LIFVAAAPCTSSPDASFFPSPAITVNVAVWPVERDRVLVADAAGCDRRGRQVAGDRRDVGELLDARQVLPVEHPDRHGPEEPTYSVPFAVTTRYVARPSLVGAATNVNAPSARAALSPIDTQPLPCRCWSVSLIPAGCGETLPPSRTPATV
jgi:hypothetical protein